MMRMVALRLALTLPILLGVSMVAFALMRALPGDFAQASAGPTMISAEALDQIRRNLGLDRPIWAQYLAWLGNALQGDLGLSFATRRPVLGELVPRFLVTAELTLIAGLMALTLGTCTGLASARLRGRVEARVVLMDERMSTAEAERRAREAGSSTDIDSLAACVILEAWLVGNREAA